MCCEATDALLEYVRRYLGLTGLRNLNAPRRLKLRVPVLKEWLQRQGQHALAGSIPDWDPVRRPTGRWKSWEMAHLKPIMDEKAVERQAKRNLVSGEATKLATAREQAHEDNRQEAIDALIGISGPPPTELVAIARDPESSPPDAGFPIKAGEGSAHNEEIIGRVEDDVADEEEEVEGSIEDSQASMDRLPTTTVEAVHTAVAQIEAVRKLLLRFEPPGPPTDTAETPWALVLRDCIQAADHMIYKVTQGGQLLSECNLMPPLPQDAALPAAMWPMADAKGAAGAGAAGPSGPVGEHVSSQEEAALLLGASQVSLTGFDVMNHSQESQVEQTSDDNGSPREGAKLSDANGGVAGATRAVGDDAEGASAKRRKLGDSIKEDAAEDNASPPEPLASCESQDRALDDLMTRSILQV